MASFELSTEILQNKINYISTVINNEIVKWYIKTGNKSDLNEFRPGFIDDDEYSKFMECFDILKQNQTDEISDDQLLYNFIIYYYLLVVVEYYILDYSSNFKSFNNEYVQEWMYKFSLNHTDWASYIRRKILNFNTGNFKSSYTPKFNPFSTTLTQYNLKK
jgi:hypothetical protein